VSTGADQARIVTGTRLGRYGEVLLAFLEGGLRLEVYNSYLLNDCPQELWDALSVEAIAKETGAAHVVLNGPRYWMMDGIGKVDNVEPLVRDFGGIAMRRAATISLDGPMDRAPYREVSVNRGSIWFFDAGQPVYELIDPAGRVFVLQAFCTGVDPSLSADELAGLGERLDLPSGWGFRARVLDEELRVDTTRRPATVVQDELENTYSLV
jgi:hypothetical protein